MPAFFQNVFSGASNPGVHLGSRKREWGGGKLAARGAGRGELEAAGPRRLCCRRSYSLTAAGGESLIRRW